MSADECRHGMVPEFCADCRGLPLDDAPGEWVIAHHFEARFEGVCARDGRPILRGMIVGATADRGYVCEGCVRELDASRP